MTGRQQPDPTPSTGSPGPTGGPEEATPLVDALAAEHAAIFAYGPIGAWLDGGDRAGAARDADRAHRDRRDTLVLRLAGAGTPPPAAQASYALPFEVEDEADALRLAVRVEERVAAVWRIVLPATTGTDRAEALAALVDAAVRATAWRAAADRTPATVPFPGAP